MNTVALVGAPERFETLISILNATQTRVWWWSPEATIDPARAEAVGAEPVAASALCDVPLLVLDAPMREARALARALGDQITGRQIVLHPSRDLEPGTHKTLSQLVLEETPTRRVGFLTGPMRPDDLEGGRLAAALCASQFPEVHKLCEQVLLSDRCRLYRSRDLIGAELAAACTRALAMVVGIALGMEQGNNIAAVLFTRGLAEIAQLIVAEGGADRTAHGMSGAGNLFADVHEPGGSPELHLGRALATAGRDALTGQDAATAASLDALTASLVALVAQHNLPRAILLRAAHGILTGVISSAQAAEAMMLLPVFDE